MESTIIFFYERSILTEVDVSEVYSKGLIQFGLMYVGIVLRWTQL